MAEPFINDPIRTDELPRLRDDAFVAVDPRYLQASLIAFGVTALVVLIVGIVGATQASAPEVPLLICGGVLALLAAAAVLRVLEVRRLGYQVRDHDLSRRSGVITQRVESLPFARVQHVSVHRGPIERALQLATLAVSSAGPDIRIPGLAHADAERIKVLITERAGVDDGDGSAGAAPTGPPAWGPPHAPPGPPAAFEA